MVLHHPHAELHWMKRVARSSKRWTMWRTLEQFSWMQGFVYPGSLLLIVSMHFFTSALFSAWIL
jgi:hypothetical protein